MDLLITQALGHHGIGVQVVGETTSITVYCSGRLAIKDIIEMQKRLTRRLPGMGYRERLDMLGLFLFGALEDLIEVHKIMTGMDKVNPHSPLFQRSGFKN